MPTSATDERGFTLVELMVVLVILGLSATAVVLASGPGTDTTLVREAERLAARASAAQDMAVLESRPVMIRVSTESYELAKRSGGEWQPVSSHAWERGTSPHLSGSDRTALFDPTGMSDPFELTLERSGATASVSISVDGRIDVRAN